MLNRIISLFESNLESDERDGAGEHAGTIEFAAAILMMEISRADSDVDPGERMVMESAMVRHFQLTDEQSAELLALAEELCPQARSRESKTKISAALEAHYDPLADDWYGTTSRVIWQC